jgi:hypothetical protein
MPSPTRTSRPLTDTGLGNSRSTACAHNKYVVRLSKEERAQLQELIRKGKSSAKQQLKARILLKADVSGKGEGWGDSQIIKALNTSVSMVYRVRQQLVEKGLRLFSAASSGQRRPFRGFSMAIRKRS